MASTTYRFGEFRLDVGRRQLWRGLQEVPLHRKAFDCIVYLIEHRERAVERNELFAAVWGDVQLSDGVLHQSIFEARRALRDNGREQRFIETVRAFGYRWAVPVVAEEAAAAPNPRAADTRRSDRPEADLVAPSGVMAVNGPRQDARRGGGLVRLGIAFAAVIALTGGAAYLWRGGYADAGAAPAELESSARVALLLPVTTATGDGDAWMRLGLMDLIAERLRAAGQPMVPSDTVIASLGGHSSDPGPEELRELAATTGARLVLAARVERSGAGWRVSLRSLAGVEPPLAARGEAGDVIKAARAAADRLARARGLMPAPERRAEPGLEPLLRRVEAAILAGEPDAARALIETADSRLQRHPAIRFNLARLSRLRHDLDGARAAYQALLTDTAVAEEPLLRLRILHCLGEIHLFRGDFAAASSVLHEAEQLLVQGATSATGGRIYATLGKVELFRGALDAARPYFAQARVALQGTGDATGLADLDNHLGVLEALDERYAEAVPRFEKAASQAAAMHDWGSELANRANLLYGHVALLDPGAAQAVESRVNELLAQVPNPWIRAWANLTQAYLLRHTGRLRAAEGVLDGVLRATEAVADLDLARQRALVLAAEMALEVGNTARAAELASEVVAGVPPNHALMAEERGRASLIAVRADLARDRKAAAAEKAVALGEWADLQTALAPRIYAALARAELAAARGEQEIARTSFESALALADTRGTPLRLLQVAQTYVPWLLAEGPHRSPDPARALVVADRLAAYADRHYESALLQLRVTHATALPAAWRVALARTRAMAGEREVPDDLRATPFG
ncbi:MAG: winged helix-turn-helix domain-containing protein [Thermoanaerobaculia bacterium]